LPACATGQCQIESEVEKLRLVVDFEEDLKLVLARLLKGPKVGLDQEFVLRKVCMRSSIVAVHRNWDVVRWA